MKSMDSSSTRDMNSPAISGDMLAAVASSGSAGDSVLDVLLSDSTREELDGWAVTLGLDPSDYNDKTQLKRAMYAAHYTQRVAGPAQVDSVQSPPQDILQVPSASAALATAMDSDKFTLTADFVAATLRKFITGDIDVAVAASTV